MSKQFFEDYDIYSINTPAPSGQKLKKLVSQQLLPLPLIRYTLFILFLLFVTPILLLLSNIISDRDLLYSILVTECFMFLFFSILSGFIFSVTKFPYLQEFKNRFGYTE